jgi:hypothetical protein
MLCGIHYSVQKYAASLANCMEQSAFWEASQETPLILWNTKFHYRIHKSQPPVLILSQINPIYATT